MVKAKDIPDYLIVAQLVIVIIYSIFFSNKYEGIFIYFSLIVFISYWLIKIVFRKNLLKKEESSGQN